MTYKDNTEEKVFAIRKPVDQALVNEDYDSLWELAENNNGYAQYVLLDYLYSLFKDSINTKDKVLFESLLVQYNLKDNTEKKFQSFAYYYMNYQFENYTNDNSEFMVDKVDGFCADKELAAAQYLLGMHKIDNDEEMLEGAIDLWNSANGYYFVALDML